MNVLFDRFVRNFFIQCWQVLEVESIDMHEVLQFKDVGKKELLVAQILSDTFYQTFAFSSDFQQVLERWT